MSSPTKEILWDAPGKLSLRRALFFQRIERALLVISSFGSIGLFIGLVVTGALGPYRDAIAWLLVYAALIGGFAILVLLEGGQALWGSYPLVRADAVVFPHRAWFSFELVSTVPWADVLELKVENPKRETGPKWEQMGPDLRITVTIRDGRVLVYNYEGQQELPWAVHDSLAKALSSAWEKNRPSTAK